MKITVINGAENQGGATAPKEIFLRAFAGKAKIKEWVLPKDLPNFCLGCGVCVTAGETKCRDARFFMPIWKSIEAADLVVFVTPVYAGHIPAALKNLLDHLTWAWLSHRPRPAIFGKRAFVITAGDAAGNKSAAADIGDSLRWLGFADVRRFGAETSSSPDNLRNARQTAAESRLRALAEKYLRTDFTVPVKISRPVKRRLEASRTIHKKNAAAEAVSGDLSVDSAYWRDNDWLEMPR